MYQQISQDRLRMREFPIVTKACVKMTASEIASMSATGKCLFKVNSLSLNKTRLPVASDKPATVRLAFCSLAPPEHEQTGSHRRFRKR